MSVTHTRILRDVPRRQRLSKPKKIKTPSSRRRYNILHRQILLSICSRTVPRRHRAVVRAVLCTYYIYRMFGKQSTEKINLLYYDPGGAGESRRRSRSIFGGTVRGGRRKVYNFYLCVLRTTGILGNRKIFRCT